MSTSNTGERHQGGGGQGSTILPPSVSPEDISAAFQDTPAQALALRPCQAYVKPSASLILRTSHPDWVTLLVP